METNKFRGKILRERFLKKYIFETQAMVFIDGQHR